MQCFQPEMVSAMITNSLENSGVSNAVLNKVQQNIDRSKSITGKVQAVITNANARKIMVGGGGYTFGFEWFVFPLNNPIFEIELIRAQETERIVTVNYFTDNNSNIMITDVWLYSKEAYPDKKS